MVVSLVGNAVLMLRRQHGFKCHGVVGGRRGPPPLVGSATPISELELGRLPSLHKYAPLRPRNTSPVIRQFIPVMVLGLPRISTLQPNPVQGYQRRVGGVDVSAAFQVIDGRVAKPNLRWWWSSTGLLWNDAKNGKKRCVMIDYLGNLSEGKGSSVQASKIY